MFFLVRSLLEIALPAPVFTLDIEDGAPEAHCVPSPVLVVILENSQHAFELIGLYIRGCR